MEKQLIEEMKKYLSAIQKEDDIANKQKLINQANKLYQKLLKNVQLLPDNTYKIHLQKQIQRVRKIIIDHQYQIKSLQSLKSNKSNSILQSKTISFKTIKSKQQLIKTIIIKQCSLKDISLNQKQLQQAYKKIQNIAQVNVYINDLIKQQGQNIEKLSQKIQQTYQNVKQTNIELKKAQIESTQGKILSIKLAIGSVLGLLGSRFFGIFGALTGFLSGFKMIDKLF